MSGFVLEELSRNVQPFVEPECCLRYQSPPKDLLLRQLGSVRIWHPTFLRCLLILHCHLNICPKSASIKIVYIFLISLAGTACTAHIFVHNLPASRHYSPGWAFVSSTTSLHLVLGFWINFFYRMGFLATCLTSILEDQGISLSLDSILWPYRHGWLCCRLNYRRHCFPGHRIAQASPPRRQVGDTFEGLSII
jgi:hypothetical protein